MKFILITGNDNHHKYLANCINEIYDLEALIIEEKKINIKTQLEKKRDRYEKKYFRENAKIIKKKLIN